MFDHEFTIVYVRGSYLRFFLNRSFFSSLSFVLLLTSLNLEVGGKSVEGWHMPSQEV